MTPTAPHVGATLDEGRRAVLGTRRHLDFSGLPIHPVETAECCRACADERHSGPCEQERVAERAPAQRTEPDKDEPAQCPSCASASGPRLDDHPHEVRHEARERGWSTPSTPPALVGLRPMEAGWFTNRTPTSNTIGCDGSGSLIVMQNGATYQHGVTDCTIQHEQVHVNDWLARYGNNICSGRARGDLPHYDPPGKAAYETFLEQSECRAWRVGRACRREKHAACTTDACRTYVQRHVDFADEKVDEYCGMSGLAKAAIGAGVGAAAGAGIGFLAGGPVGALVGAGIGAVVGGVGSLLF